MPANMPKERCKKLSFVWESWQRDKGLDKNLIKRLLCTFHRCTDIGYDGNVCQDQFSLYVYVPYDDAT